jgi:hypothetical protein
MKFLFEKKRRHYLLTGTGAAIFRSVYGCFSSILKVAVGIAMHLF